MKNSLPAHLARYRDLAAVLFKYGRSDLVRKAGLEDVLRQEEQPTAAAEAADLANDLERLGPTFIKLGQLLSTRPDLLPPPVLASLSRLQDDVEPVPFDEVERIVSSELGVRISKAFLEFSSTPMGSASLGQVHHAILRDRREVAVKVQRPDVRSRVALDLEVLEPIVAFLDQHSPHPAGVSYRKVLAEFRRSLTDELDYRIEADNLTKLRHNLQSFPHLVVPAPIRGYSTSRVLTMEYVEGCKLTEVSPLIRLDMDTEALADEAFKGYLKQIFVDGFYHADPHPGNVLLLDHGRLALIDLGMVGRLRASLQQMLLRFLIAVAEGNSDDAATTAIRIGNPQDAFDELDFRHQMAELVARQQSSVGHMDVGRSVIEVCALAASHGMSVPEELTLLGKTLLELDRIGHLLCPTFNPSEAVRRHAGWLLERHLMQHASVGNTLNAFLELKEFGQQLPRRLNTILDTVARDQLTVRIQPGDELRVMEGLQKVANRIAMGLVLAALIVGGALMMQIDTEWRILGYPALAMLCFLASAFGGVLLIITIIRNDREPC
ncbi:MAG: ABC1 kinase family protein [Candidatus Xenobia bacterium]